MAEVYRYDATSGELSCLSCSPTDSPATGDAGLQTVGFTFLDPGSTKIFSLLSNLRDDGRRAFFESLDPLVVGDTNGVLDVYEWEEEGIGSCPEGEEGGCVYLISSGHSSRPSYLYGVSASGNDVFFTTADLLTGSDRDETPSIYDARVGGGEPASGVCEAGCCGGECRPPTIVPAPTLPSANSAPSGRSGNVEEKPRPPKCPKGKHRVKRHGHLRCVKNHRRHHHRGARR